MYMLILFSIIAAIVYICTYVCETFKYPSIGSKVGATIILGSIFNFFTGIMFLIVSVMVLCNTDGVIEKTEKYPLVLVEGNYACITDKGISVVYKKDNQYITFITSSVNETTDNTPYYQIDTLVHSSKWLFEDGCSHKYSVYFPSSLMKITKPVVKVEKQ